MVTGESCADRGPAGPRFHRISHDRRVSSTGADFVAPMLAVPGRLPADPADWSAEVKWDGIRLITAVSTDGSLRCWTRAAREVTASWPEIADAAAGRSLLLDAEVVALDASGRPSFGLLQQRGQLRPRGARAPQLVLMVFDLLAVDGVDLCPRPWHERRRRLEDLDLSAGHPHWQVPAASPDPAALHAFTAENELEGVVCKRIDSPYRPGVRSAEWLKVKHVRTQEVVLGGWLPGQGGRTGELGALLLGIPVPGVPDGRPLRFVGRVGTGFTAAARRDLLDRLAPLTVPRSPFVDIPAAEARAATWVEPALVGEVAFGEWTLHDRLRHPSWRGLRADKSPADVVVEADG
jgi:bifunctional non-homologous end joining protein LigD